MSAKNAAATAARVENLRVWRANLAERLRAHMAAEGCTYGEAANALGVHKTTAGRIKAEFGIVSPREAVLRLKGRVAKKNGAALHEACRANDAEVLKQIEAQRGAINSLYAVSVMIRVGYKRVADIWRTAHPGERFGVMVLPPPRPGPRKATAAKDAAQQAQRIAGAKIGRLINSATPMAIHHLTPEQRAERDRAIAHGKRTAVLPDVTDSDAARLVAEFLSRRPVTICPPRYGAPVLGAVEV